MLKHTFVSILGLIIAILAGLALSKADQTQYANVLNHAGIADDAFVYHTKRTKKVNQAVTQLEQTGLKDYQVQFALDKTTSMVFAEGEYTSLPIDSGHFFTSADFKSSLPVAVVGANAAANLYQAGEQSYLPLKGHYVAVVGTVKTNQGSRLNDHIFLNASTDSKLVNPQLKDVEIFVDGIDESDVPTFTRIFGAKPHHMTVATTQSHRSWTALYGVWVLAIVGTAILMVAVALLATLVSPHAQVGGLDSPLRNRYVWGMGTSFLPGMGIAIVLGAVIAWWQFYINNYFRLILVEAGLLGVFILATQVFMHLRLRKEEQ